MTKRLFIAIDVKPQLLLSDFYRELKHQLKAEAIKWVDENIFHLTLKFLGETEENRVAGIKQALAEICGSFKPFSFQVKGLGYFGPEQNPRVIFSEIGNDLPLRDLSRIIDEKLSFIGFEKEEKGFKAHLTYGRVKFIKNRAEFSRQIKENKGKFLQEVKAEEVILYESILKPEGPEYIALFRASLT
jgi:RNA 2',3'-cyclic 3'-phosphodiesterase